jgi:hypothetical protein
LSRRLMPFIDHADQKRSFQLNPYILEILFLLVTLFWAVEWCHLAVRGSLELLIPSFLSVLD